MYYIFMRRWLPQPSLGRWVGLILLILALVAASMVALRLGRTLARPPDQWPFDLALYGQLVSLMALLLVSGALAYRVAGAFTLWYELDRNGLYIHWMGNRAVVPLSQIESVDVGAPGATLPGVLLQRIGYYWGQGRTATGERLHLFATQRLQRCLVLHTPGNAYAISPVDQDTFVQELEQRRNLGAIKPLAPTLEQGRIFLYAFWNDPIVRRTLVVAFALNLLLLGYLAARYPQLGSTVAMRFNAAGQGEGLQPRHQVLFLPLAALGLCLINTGLGLTLYQRTPSGARLLQLTSILMQVLFGIAVLTIISK